MEAKAYRTFASTLRGTSGSARSTRESAHLDRAKGPIVDKSQRMFESSRLVHAQLKPVIPGQAHTHRRRTVCGAVSKSANIEMVNGPCSFAQHSLYEDNTEYDSQYSAFPRQASVRAGTPRETQHLVPEPEPQPQSIRIQFGRVRKSVKAPWAEPRVSQWSVAPVMDSISPYEKRLENSRVQHAQQVLSGGLGDLNTREWFKHSGLRFDAHPLLTRDDVKHVLQEYKLELSAEEQCTVQDVVIGRIVGDRVPKAEYMDVTYKLKCDPSVSKKGLGFLGYYKQVRQHLATQGLEEEVPVEHLTDGQLYEKAVRMEGIPDVEKMRPKQCIDAKRAKFLLSKFFSGKSRASQQKLGIGRYMQRPEQQSQLNVLNIRTSDAELESQYQEFVQDSDLAREEGSVRKSQSEDLWNTRKDMYKGSIGDIVFHQDTEASETGEGCIMTSLFFKGELAPEHVPIYTHSMPADIEAVEEPHMYNTVESIFQNADKPGCNRRVFPAVVRNPVVEERVQESITGSTQRIRAKKNQERYLQRVASDSHNSHSNYVLPPAKEMMMKYTYKDTRGMIGHDNSNHTISANNSSANNSSTNNSSTNKSSTNNMASDTIKYIPTNRRDIDLQVMQQQDKQRKQEMLAYKTSQRQILEDARVARTQDSHMYAQQKQTQNQVYKMVKQLNEQHKTFCSSTDTTLVLQ